MWTKLKLGISLLLMVSYLGGCASSKTVELTAEQEALTSWKERTSSFGNSNYSTSEAEALEDLNTKFDVELLPSFSELETLAQNEMNVEGITVAEPVYTIQALDDELIVANRILFYQADKVMAYVDIVETYTYIAVQKKVKVASQTFEMTFWDGGTTYVGKDFSEFVSSVATLVAVSKDDLSQTLDKLKSLSDEANQEWSVIDTADEAYTHAGFGQTLLVEIGNNGLPKKVAAYVRDYRN